MVEPLVEIRAAGLRLLPECDGRAAAVQQPDRLGIVQAHLDFKEGRLGFRGARDNHDVTAADVAE